MLPCWRPPQETRSHLMEDEPPRKCGMRREAWKKLSYHLTILTYAFGVWNVWRLPYLTEEHGILFPIIWASLLLFVFTPLIVLELYIGQIFRSPSSNIWFKVSPWSSGISVSGGICMGYAMIYSSVISGWALIYAITGFIHPSTTDIRWETCLSIAGSSNETTVNNTCPVSNGTCEAMSPTVYYFYAQTLNSSNTILKLQGVSQFVNVKLLLAVGLFWLVTLLLVWKSRVVLGKLIYAIGPIFLTVWLAIFIQLGVFHRLDFEAGVKTLFNFDNITWRSLLNGQLWLDATTQAALSAGVVFGVIWVKSAFNYPGSNFKVDALFGSICTIFISMFFLVTSFAALGRYEADWKGRGCADDMCAVGSSCKNYHKGPAFVFIVISHAMRALPFPSVWNMLFFFSLVAAQLFGNAISVVAAANAIWRSQRLSQCCQRKWIPTTLICLVCVLFSYPFTTSAGIYLIRAIDVFVLPYCIITIAIWELLTLVFAYGINRVDNLTEGETGSGINVLLKIFICVVAPLFLVITLILGTYYTVRWQPTFWMFDQTFGNLRETVYPSDMLWMALVLIILCLMFLIIVPLLFKCRLLKGNEGDQEGLITVANREPLYSANQGDWDRDTAGYQLPPWTEWDFPWIDEGERNLPDNWSYYPKRGKSSRHASRSNLRDSASTTPRLSSRNSPRTPGRKRRKDISRNRKLMDDTSLYTPNY